MSAAVHLPRLVLRLIYNGFAGKANLADARTSSVMGQSDQNWRA
jgi:hypothetical protein